MTPDKVRLLAPEFVATDDATILSFIGLAAERHDAAAWGRVFGTAMAHLAAHMMTLAAQANDSPVGNVGQQGNPTSVTVGRWSMSFGGGLTGTESGFDGRGDAYYATTRHGLAYLALRRTRAAGRSRLVMP